MTGKRGEYISNNEKFFCYVPLFFCEIIPCLFFFAFNCSNNSDETFPVDPYKVESCVLISVSAALL